MGCGYDVRVLGLLNSVSAAISFCICTEDVMCLWFGKDVGVVSDDSEFRCAWGCSCGWGCSFAPIETFVAIGLYITSGKGVY